MPMNTQIAQSLEKGLTESNYRVQYKNKNLSNHIFAYTILEKLLPNNRVVRVVIRPNIAEVIIEGDPESDDRIRLSENKFEDINADARLHDTIINYILLMEEIYSTPNTAEEN